MHIDRQVSDDEIRAELIKLYEINREKFYYYNHPLTPGYILEEQYASKKLHNGFQNPNLAPHIMTDAIKTKYKHDYWITIMNDLGQNENISDEAIHLLFEMGEECPYTLYRNPRVSLDMLKQNIGAESFLFHRCYRNDATLEMIRESYQYCLSQWGNDMNFLPFVSNDNSPADVITDAADRVTESSHMLNIICSKNFNLATYKKLYKRRNEKPEGKHFQILYLSAMNKYGAQFSAHMDLLHHIARRVPSGVDSRLASNRNITPKFVKFLSERLDEYNKQILRRNPRFTEFSK
jgi:hypothetical protein